MKFIFNQDLPVVELNLIKGYLIPACKPELGGRLPPTLTWGGGYSHLPASDTMWGTLILL